MGKWCLQASTFIFDRFFVKLSGNQDRHKISDEFAFRPDLIRHFGVTHPEVWMKFSIDLLWNLQDQLSNLDQILYISPVGLGKGCFQVLEQIPSHLWLPWQQKAPIDL